MGEYTWGIMGSGMTRSDEIWLVPQIKRMPPLGEEIAAVVRIIHMGRSVGLSGMQEEHLKAWIK